MQTVSSAQQQQQTMKNYTLLQHYFESFYFTFSIIEVYSVTI